MNNVGPTYSTDTVVQMSREVNQSVERDSDNRLCEGWGEVLKWMDLCAAVSAMKHAKSGKLVTAQVDDMRILQPLLYGDMLTVRAQVNNSWNTSMEVETLLEAENLLNEQTEKRIICVSYFTFVLIKDQSAPQKLPEFIPSTPEDQQKYYEARERRQIRFRRREVIKGTVAAMENPSISLEDFKDSNITKTITESAINSIMVVLPSHANPHGNTFGGQIMDWMEETAKLAGRKHSRRPMYLHHIDDIHFIKPSTVGDYLIIKAQVNRVFTDTLEVGVRVEACGFANSTETRLINSGYLTYGCHPPKPRLSTQDVDQYTLKEEPLAPIIPTNERETKQYNDAIGRRAVRMARTAVSKTHQAPEWSPALSRELIYSNVKDVLKIAVSDSINWWEMTNQENISVSVYDAEEVTLCKMEFMLFNDKHSFSAKDIFPAILVCENRKKWDTMLKDHYVIETIDECNDIIYSSYGDDKTTHDLCLLRSWRTPELGFTENQYILSLRSISHPKVPVIPGIERGSILPSGFILSNCTDNKIKVTYLMQISGHTLQFTLERIPSVTFVRFKNLMDWYSELTPESLKLLERGVLC